MYENVENIKKNRSPNNQYQSCVSFERANNRRAVASVRPSARFTDGATSVLMIIRMSEGQAQMQFVSDIILYLNVLLGPTRFSKLNNGSNQNENQTVGFKNALG